MARISPGRQAGVITVLAVLFGLGVAFAQQQNAPRPFPLETIRVEGNQRIPTVRIVAASGLKIGAPVVVADFDAARARLLATGAFASVGYEFKPSASKNGYDSVFQVVEVDQVFPYRFEDLSTPESVLRAALRIQEPLFGDQIPGTQDVLNRFAKEIAAVVGGGVKVKGQVNADLPGQLSIVFRPDTPRANIAEVRFTGNQVLPSDLLLNTISGVAIGVPYGETRMRLLLDSSIRPLYEARGRIRVAFPKISVGKTDQKDTEGVVVTVEIDEGPSYKLGTVRFAGIAPSEVSQVEKTANFETSDIANFDNIKAGLDRVYARYKNKGYLRAAGGVDRDVNDQEHIVNLMVTIQPGPQFKMGKLQIVGLDIISEPPIRKSWLLKPGDPFQPDYPDSFLKDLRDQQVFENLGKTEAETHVNEDAHSVDVTLHFSSASKDKEKEKKRATF